MNPQDITPMTADEAYMRGLSDGAREALRLYVFRSHGNGLREVRKFIAETASKAASLREAGAQESPWQHKRASKRKAKQKETQ